MHALGQLMGEVLREQGGEELLSLVDQDRLTAIRRQGITGREPAGDTELREGDEVVIYGLPAALEHAEAVLLAG